jgi:hypothetical protein
LRCEHALDLAQSLGQCLRVVGFVSQKTRHGKDENAAALRDPSVVSSDPTSGQMSNSAIKANPLPFWQPKGGKKPTSIKSCGLTEGCPDFSWMTPGGSSSCRALATFSLPAALYEVAMKSSPARLSDDSRLLQACSSRWLLPEAERVEVAWVGAMATRAGQSKNMRPINPYPMCCALISQSLHQPNCFRPIRISS